MGVNYRLEPIIEGDALTADLMAEYKEKSVFIDVHGFQHYCRNIDRMKGGGVLKARIFQGFGESVKYVVVPIFEWQLLDDFQDKKQYLERLL